MSGFAGFGANLLALPILAQVMSRRCAVPMLLVLDRLSATLLSARHRISIDGGELRRLVPPPLLGMALGLPVLRHAAQRWLLLSAGGFVGGLALWSLFGRPDRRPSSSRWARPLGLAGGVFSTLFGTGRRLDARHPPRRIADTARLRATLGAVIQGWALARLRERGVPGV